MASVGDSPAPALDIAWQLLLAVAECRRAGSLPGLGTGCRFEDGALVIESTSDEIVPTTAQLHRDAHGEFVAGTALSDEQRDFVTPFLPLLAAGPDRPVVIAHLGQSIDGCIATASGHSHVVTGHEDFVHMHRLRALADAVVVGGGTIAADDPQLTTRLVEGPDPVRVVIDPEARLPSACGVFSDRRAATVQIVSPAAHDAAVVDARSSQQIVVEVPRDAVGTCLPDLVETLGQRGLHAIFVEGGGVTVTRFLEAGLLDRLHIAVAPVIIGNGRPGLQLPSALTMSDSLRPPCEIRRLGDDVLWDFDLRSAVSPGVRETASDVDRS